MRLQGDFAMPVFNAKNDGIELECEISCAGSTGIVICHPHPLHGGTMQSAVVGALFQSLGETGCSVLRFNFRGVGGSDGRYGGGEGEVNDALGALDYLKEQCGCGEVVLAGYSFGAAVALKALGLSDASRYVAVALPTETSREVYGQIPIEVTVPSLVAAGDMDDICRLENVKQIVSFREQPGIIKLAGCDHFFSNLESLRGLCENVVRFIAENNGENR
jgi:alpha/beta superfamily hydrolase